MNYDPINETLNRRYPKTAAFEYSQFIITPNKRISMGFNSQFGLGYNELDLVNFINIQNSSVIPPSTNNNIIPFKDNDGKYGEIRDWLFFLKLGGGVNFAFSKFMATPFGTIIYSEGNNEFVSGLFLNYLSSEINFRKFSTDYNIGIGYDHSTARSDGKKVNIFIRGGFKIPHK